MRHSLGFEQSESDMPSAYLGVQDAVLAMPMDVEDLARLGRRKEVCSYYAARDALQEADLVLLPYPALLLQACPISIFGYSSLVHMSA